MVKMTEMNSPSAGVNIDAWANLSISLERLCVCFAGLSVITIAIAMWLTWQGFWPVLAFAVAHLLLTGAALRLAWRANWRRLHIEIDEQQIRICDNSAGRISKRTFNSTWAQVDWLSFRKRNELPRLFLKSEREKIELGSFLNENERRQLGDFLRASLLKYGARRTLSRPL